MFPEFLQAGPLFGIQGQTPGDKIKQQRRGVGQKILQPSGWLAVVKLKVVGKVLSLRPDILLNTPIVTGHPTTEKMS